MNLNIYAVDHRRQFDLFGGFSKQNRWMKLNPSWLLIEWCVTYTATAQQTQQLKKQNNTTQKTRNVSYM